MGLEPSRPSRNVTGRGGGSGFGESRFSAGPRRLAQATGFPWSVPRSITQSPRGPAGYFLYRNGFAIVNTAWPWHQRFIPFRICRDKWLAPRAHGRVAASTMIHRIKSTITTPDGNAFSRFHLTLRIIRRARRRRVKSRTGGASLWHDRRYRSGTCCQLTAIRRGIASFAFGNVNVSTPSSSLALIDSRSILPDNVNARA